MALFHTRTQARRLLRELRRSEDVLTREKYRSVEFCELFFERCDAVLFESPSAGLAWAKKAPPLAELIAVESCGSESRQRQLRLRGLSILASAYRACGRLDDAEKKYREAFDLCRGGVVSDAEHANLYRRKAVLRMAQDRLREALALADRAIGISRGGAGIEDTQDLARGLVIRGIVRGKRGEHDLAINDFSESLIYASPKKSPRTHYAGLHNISVLLGRHCFTADQLGAVHLCVRKARRLLHGKRKSVPKMKLCWIEGLILVKFGSTRRAEQCLAQARDGLVELGAWSEAVLVSLDLVALLWLELRWVEVAQAAAEIRDQLETFCFDRDILSAVRALHDAARAQRLGRELVETTRQHFWYGLGLGVGRRTSRSLNPPPYESG